VKRKLASSTTPVEPKLNVCGIGQTDAGGAATPALVFGRLGAAANVGAARPRQRPANISDFAIIANEIGKPMAKSEVVLFFSFRQRKARVAL
jgi:hypothetical protein